MRRRAGVLLAVATLLCVAGVVWTPLSETATAPVPPSSASEQEKTVVLHIEDLTCEGCAWQIREALTKIDGVEDVMTSVEERRIAVRYDQTRVALADVTNALNAVGYSATEAR